MRSDAERLRDILEAIGLIAEQGRKGRAAFNADHVLRTAIVKWIEVMGEAARGLSPELRAAHPEIPWAGIIGKRNRLAHGYFEVESDLVWAVVMKSCLLLKPRCGRSCGSSREGGAGLSATENHDEERERERHQASTHGAWALVAA